MKRSSRWISLAALAIFFAAATSAHAQQETIFSDVDGTQTATGIVGTVVGDQPNSPGNFQTIGYDFTVPDGPDVQLDDGEVLASWDSSTPLSDLVLDLYSSVPAGPASTAIDTMTAGGLTGTPSLIQFNSTSNPILSAGQEYWLTVSTENPSTTAVWDFPATASPGYLIVSQDNGSFTGPFTNNRGAFALAGTPTQWQTTFSGSATIGGTGMQNAVMVCESFNSSGGVLTKFVQPLGNFNANQATNYNFTQPLGVNAASAIYTILGTYGTGGVILGTTQTFGNNAVSNSSTFSSIFNGADEGTLYSELASGDYADIQNFFDTQLADFGGGDGSGGLPDIVLDGSDFQNMVAESGSLATGGACYAPPTDYVAMSTATQIGTGSLELSTTPEPSAALLLLPLLTAPLLRRTRRETMTQKR